MSLLSDNLVCFLSKFRRGVAFFSHKKGLFVEKKFGKRPLARMAVICLLFSTHFLHQNLESVCQKMTKLKAILLHSLSNNQCHLTLYSE